MSIQTQTPLSSLQPLPDRQALLAAFKGQRIEQLRTPALLVDARTFERNCQRVTAEAQGRGMSFRAHIKTHKTVEGTRLQAQAGTGVRAFIASTLPEIYQILQSGLVEEGLVDDASFNSFSCIFFAQLAACRVLIVQVLYSMPIGSDKLDELASLQSRYPQVALRLMVDHAKQVEFLQRYGIQKDVRWSVFVKVDGGGKRAGAPPKSAQMRDLINALLSSPAVSVHGFYSHFGQSYASRQLSDATDYFYAECDCVNTAAQTARSMGLEGDWVLSVGATPTAHAATIDKLKEQQWEGRLELHAGCYCMNDCQQLATGLISPTDVSISVLGRIVSSYADRGEAMCDVGALAVSKDLGPFVGYGRVCYPERLRHWDLGRVSQEHGTLCKRQGTESAEEDPEIGELVRITPQHACLACANFAWYYVVDGDQVVDIWVPCKGW